jgi:signal transduction histidine kinase
MPLRPLNLRTRLALGLAVICLVLLVPLALSLRSLAGLRGEISAFRSQEFYPLSRLAAVRDLAGEIRERETNLLILRDVASVEAMERTMRLLTAIAAQPAPQDGMAPPAEVEHAIQPSLRRLVEVLPAEIAAVREGRPSEADTLAAKVVQPTLVELERQIVLQERAIRGRANTRAFRAGAAVETMRVVAGLSLAMALAVAALIAVLLTRSISRPVRELDQGMAAVADGDFDRRLAIDARRRDEFGRLAESYRVMTHELKALDRLKAEFISVASHELKTPINVIIGYLQLLTEGVYGAVSDKQREVLGTVTNQAQTLTRLVKQLLDVSRFEAGGGRIEPRPFPVDVFVAELRQAFHVLALQRDVRFTTDIRGGAAGEVFWDHDRMNEVLGNLLSNAFKFTPAGGTVDLTVEPDGAAEFLHAPRLKLTVRDSGAGIPPEQIAHIFEKFYQADNQKSANQAGTGLGLSIAREIVRAHGGEIECTSSLGKGTEFIIRLPRRVERRGSGAFTVVAAAAAAAEPASRPSRS